VVLRKRLLLALPLAFVACGHAPPPMGLPLLPATRKWQHVFESADPEDRASLQSPLASDGVRVFASTRTSLTERERLSAIDRATGNTAWVRDGVAGSLAAGPGVLVVRSGTRLVSLDPATGKTHWSADTGCSGTLPPVLDGTRVLVAGSHLASVDLASGRTAFSEPLRHAAVTAPVVAGTCLLLGEADGNLRCREPQSGRTRWAFLMQQPLETAPTAFGRRVYVATADRRVVALDLASGGFKWGFKLGTGVSVPPQVAGRFLLVASNEAVLYGLARGNGNMSWRAPLPSRPQGPPMVTGRQVVIACQPNRLLSFDLETGKAGPTLTAGIPRYDPAIGQSELRVPPLVADGSLLVGLRNPPSVLGFEPGTPAAGPQTPPPFPPDLASEVPAP
jgi:outer membrane protein assembly factor BamB